MKLLIILLLTLSDIALCQVVDTGIRALRAAIFTSSKDGKSDVISLTIVTKDPQDILEKGYRHKEVILSCEKKVVTTALTDGVGNVRILIEKKSIQKKKIGKCTLNAGSKWRSIKLEQIRSLRMENKKRIWVLQKKT